MILEVADIRIAPGRQAEFDEAIARGVATVIAQAAGYRAHQIRKGIESPERYLLMSAPRSGLRPARPPRGSRKLGAARRFLESAPRSGLRPARPPRGSRKLGAARRVLESAPRSGLRPARPPRGSRKLGAARCFLEIEWETLEHHTVQFRQGPLFAQWRAIVGPFFTAPPTVEHFTLLPTPR